MNYITLIYNYIKKYIYLMYSAIDSETNALIAYYNL